MAIDETKSAAVLNRFLREYVTDRAAGRALDLEQYLARYPGFEELIEREHARLEAGDATERNADPAFPFAERDFGPYRLERELGRGGQGAVFLAQDTRLGRPVAIKVLTGFTSLSPVSLQRFYREAAVASRLDHPGICAVYECDDVNGVPYVAMRYVQGETLASLVARARRDAVPIGVERALALAEKVARALHVAHEAGVVHRDVKPGNLMVTPADEPVVLDFGLARELEGASTLTASGELFGSPSYMSPEQIDGVSSVDRRADVHALGTTLYELVTLSPPFRAPTREGLFRQILTERAADPRRANPRIPRDLRVVLDTALEKDPDRRYQTALDLAEDLCAVRESRPIAARPVGPLTRAARWAVREPRQAALVAGVLSALVLAAGLGGFLFARAPEIQAGELELARRRRDDLITAALGGKMTGHTEERLRAALVDDPDNGAVRNSLALLLLQRGDGEASLRVLDEAPAGGDDGRTLARMRVAVLDGLERGDEALELERELGEPRDALECWSVGRSLLSSASAANHRRGFALLERAIYLAPRPREVFYHDMIRAATLVGDWDKAVLVARVLEARYPDSSVSWWAISMARSGVDPAGMRAALERSIELDPNFPAALASYAGALVHFDELERGREMLQRALDNSIGGPRERRYLRFAFVGMLVATERYDEALAELDRALEEEPDEPEILRRKAEILADLGLADEAAGLRERAHGLELGD
jgi:tetratricopeptide (TPR) repeat protein/predicted Ser/Thr protein kinase